MPNGQTRIKTALFLDFDNIYLGLKAESATAAERFANAPDRWLKWIEEEMPTEHGADGEAVRRSLLVRRCYLNPEWFGRQRAYFTRSGFSVVDCPPLTKRGKNSADIVMVMDILDVLEHNTRFDEFIIMSGDADFTPVLQRLRMHDRRTAVLVSGMVAPAYRAACDLLIDEDTFIEKALGVEPEVPLPRIPESFQPSVRPSVLDAIARRVYEEASAGEGVLATDLPPVFREFPEFTPSSNWLGFFSLRALAEAVVASHPELEIVEGDPQWRVGIRPAGRQPSAGREDVAPDELQRRIVATVTRLVAASPEPVVMARVAQAVIRECGPQVLDSHWLGKGSFKDFLQSVEDLGLETVSWPLPGYLYDPARHEAPESALAPDGLSGLPDELASFIRRIHQLTDVPKLTPRQYRILFEATAKELGRAPFSLMGTGKAVRDQCLERGESISRQAATFLLRGLSYVGYKLNRNGEVHQPEEIAATFRGNVANLMRQAQAPLSPEELLLLDQWLLDPGEETASASGPGERPPLAAVSAEPPAEPVAGDGDPDFDPWTRREVPESES